MSRFAAALQRVAEDLRELAVPYALLGGFAVSARTEPRTTKDVDLAVLAADDPAAEEFAFALSARGYEIDTTIEHSRSGRLATLRTMAPTGTIVDFLFASSGVEPEIVAAADEL